MPSEQVAITFQPSGRTVSVLPGTKILEAAGRAGLTLQTPCGGKGTCGKCRVQVTTGAAAPSEADRGAFSDAELADGWRLACQTAVREKTVAAVPEASLFGAGHQILTETEQSEGPILPAVRKIYVELPEPTLDDDAPDLLRLEKRIGSFKVDLHLLRRLSGRLRASGFKGTAVLADHRLIDFEAGDTTEQCYGVAFDVGTTTMVGVLLDLCTGAEMAVASDLNPQVSFGDDVLSRIQRSSESEAGLEQLRRVVVEAIGRLIETMCAKAGVEQQNIYEITVAGNTTMEHLLCGVDPTQLGQVPFVPAYGRGLVLHAGEVGFDLHEDARAYVFPVIGGFVGGDTVAGLLATRLTELDGPVLMVDIGTNGEIVLAHEGQLWASSTAAGPAFEGARISCGMRAAAGAIEKVVVNEDVVCSVIGNAEPIGLCGSGLIDAAAELLDLGVVSPLGRMLGPEDLSESLPETIRRRVVPDDDGKTAFLLAGGHDGQPPITLLQKDIRELQLATGAIRAGIRILLRKASLRCEDLKRVLIAGGFGSFIRRSRAQRIGLLPTEVDRQRIRYVGNASLNGARWALLSADARKRAEELARQARHVGLSRDVDFQSEFAEAMIFPE